MFRDSVLVDLCLGFNDDKLFFSVNHIKIVLEVGREHEVVVGDKEAFGHVVDRVQVLPLDNFLNFIHHLELFDHTATITLDLHHALQVGTERQLISALRFIQLEHVFDINCLTRKLEENKELLAKTELFGQADNFHVVECIGTGFILFDEVLVLEQLN